MAKNRKSFKNSAVFLQILACFFIVLLVVLLAALMLTLRYSLNNARERIDSSIFSTASVLAGNQEVVNALRTMNCPDSLMNYLDDFVLKDADVDVISIANQDSVRVYHVLHERIGGSFVGGDQGRALAGESYLSDAEGTMGMQRRAFVPVKSAGEVIGFVMASSKQDSIDSLQKTITVSFLKMGALLFGLALLLSVMITLIFKVQLHGYDPEALVTDYLMQSDVLNGLEEGLISVDGQGRIRMLNRAAEALFGKSGDVLSGTELFGHIRMNTGASLLGAQGENIPTNKPNVLASVSAGAGENRTVILKDRSVALRQAEQLNGTRYVISALRANNHEFMNKLQVISGLLQMGRIDEAKEYIGNISAEHGKTVGPIMQYIGNPNVAALLLGKLHNLHELEIHLTILNNSSLPRHSAYLTTNEQVTVIGNLLENAMEAINQSDSDGERSIVLQLLENEESLLIEVSDTGPGIPPEVRDSIFDEGFSTKARGGRGFGLTLVKTIVDAHGGNLEVESAESGTVFTLIFTNKRERMTAE